MAGNDARHWAEISYQLGRLQDGRPVDPDEVGVAEAAILHTVGCRPGISLFQLLAELEQLKLSGREIAEAYLRVEASEFMTVEDGKHNLT